ncbi:MAG: WYL domain-containing protein [Acidimicrobiia bacterium]|nr:WYL domain-containing protein [Acidimicrobiia bacterium]
MAALTKQRQFDVLRAVLGLVEERGSATLAECVELTGVPEDVLRTTLGAVLYLDYRTADGSLVSESSSFLLDEQSVVTLTATHWLRDLAAEPPPPDTAMRLLVAGMTMQAIAERPTPDLDTAVTKLAGEVAVQLRMPVDLPPALSTLRDALEQHRSVHVRYLSDGADASTERELLPYRVWSRWGHWYLTARDVTQPEAHQFRVDRVLSASVGATPFDPPDDVELPEWFDLSTHARTVRVRMRADAIESLPAPHRLGPSTDLGGGRVELDVAVTGDRRLDHLLVCLPVDTEIVEPAASAERRREYAARLLARYC